MRISHPLWRGFWLAAAMTASLVLLGFTDSAASFRLNRPALAFAGAITVGAFLASLPGRLHKGRSPAQPTTWQRCLRGFLCGAGMMVGLSLAGDGRILSTLLTGSPGAYGFCLAALFTGFITCRIMGRNRA